MSEYEITPRAFALVEGTNIKIQDYMKMFEQGLLCPMEYLKTIRQHLDTLEIYISGSVCYNRVEKSFLCQNCQALPPKTKSK